MISLTPLKIFQVGNRLQLPDSNSNVAVLQSVLADSVYIEWEVNSTYQASFTAYNDGSDAFSLLEVQNMVQIEDQWFVIKQIEPDYFGGINTVEVSLSHISNEISRIRHYSSNDPIDWGNKSHYGGTGSQTLQVPTGDDGNTVKQVLPQDLLKTMFDGNGWNVTYQVIGNFSQANVDNPDASGSGKDFIDRILEAWPDAVFYPDNLNLRIYSHDAFYQNHGHRIDYLHDTPEIQLTYDSTNMFNGARLVGATYSQDQSTDTGLPNGTAGKGATAVQADARKYLGVPYVYGGAGGARGGNPMSGMDCSSFVSQVYKDFGINIPAYTVSMEPYGHQVSSPQTGDMGFYGSHGGSYHITLALDSQNMIFEPQPGEVCKEEPISWYPPSWWERNDDMAKVVGASGDDGTDATTTESQEMYYFAPFWYQNEESHNRWGTFGGDDITSDTIQDPNQMKQYADSQFKLNPDLSISATMKDNAKPIAGDMVRVEVKPKNWVTTVALVGYQWYPRSTATQTTVTYNSNAKTILDYDNATNSNVTAIKKQVQRVLNTPSATISGRETWTESEVKAYDDSQRG